MLFYKCIFSLILGSINTSTLTADVYPNSSKTNTATEAKAAPALEGEWQAWLIEGSQVAQDFVTLIDQGRYGESWDRGSKLFQSTISRGEWEQALALYRKPLGTVTSRSIKDLRTANDPRGLPKGPYMVVEYTTSFSGVPNSGELLTLMREKDGKWKVLTYQVN